MGLHFERLDESRKEDILALYRSASDYFLLASGRVPDSCDELLFDLPPGVSLECKRVIGADQEGILLGLVDCVFGFPDEHTAMIGLLLVHGARRGQGIGAALFSHAVGLFKARGMKHLRIGVLNTNENALKFWSSLGFHSVEMKGPVQYGEKRHMINVMTMDLPGEDDT